MLGSKYMKKIMCPCCKYYTHDHEQYLFEICEVCFWQFDGTAHDIPSKISGANKLSLKEVRENYQKYGVCKKEFKHLVREPLIEELSENN